MEFREFNILFLPHYVKRTEHDPHIGIVATEMFSIFGEIAQQD